MTSTLLTGIGELVTNDPARDGLLGAVADAALVIDGGTVAWTGRAADAPDADVRVELGVRADRNRPLIGDVTDGHAHDRGHSGDVGRLANEHVERVRRKVVPRRGICEVPDDESGDVRERATHSELCQHSVEAIGRLADVLEHEQCAAIVGSVGRACERGEKREVAADQPAVPAAAAHGARAIGDATWIMSLDDGTNE